MLSAGFAGCSTHSSTPVAGARERARVASSRPISIESCGISTGVHASRETGDPKARAGAQRGLDFLGKEAAAWQEQNKCYGCHVQAVTLEAMAIGKRHGYEVSRAALSTVLQGMLTINGGARGPNGLSVGGDPRHLIETSRSFGGAAFAQYDERIGQELREDLLRVAEQIRASQQEDGSLLESYVNPPVAAGRLQATMQGAQTFRQAHARTADERWLAPLRKAEAYLTAQARTLVETAGAPTQDLNYAVIGLAAAGMGSSEPLMRALGRKIEERQRPEGGWGFQADDSANPFATGQTLFALRRLGRSDGDAIVTRGTRWLLEKQQASGGWSSAGFGKAEAMWGVLGLVSIDVVSVSVAGLEDGQHLEGAREVRATAADNAGGGVKAVEALLDDVPIEGSCGGSLALRLDPSGLSAGMHLLDLVAHNAAGQKSRRRIAFYTGPATLTQIGTRFDDGGTLVSMRNIGAAPGTVELRIFSRDGAARGPEIFREARPAAQGPMSFFWKGEKKGMYVAEIALKDARGGVAQKEEVAFFHDTPEAQRASFGEIEGQLAMDGGELSANTRVDLVDKDGNVVQSAVTTGAGQYRFKNVDAGKYRVRVAKKGFRAAEAPVQAAPSAAPAKVDMQIQMH
jgi:hypothetical protein